MKWSHSAHGTIRRCQRLFAISHLMASATAKDPRRHEAYILKQLQSLTAWQGSLLHRVLASRFFAENIRAARPFDAAVLTATAQELARRQLEFSAALRYRQSGMTKSAAGEVYCALVEHEHGREIPRERLEDIFANLERGLENLGSQHEFLAMIQAGSNHRAEIPVTFRLGDSGLPVVTATLDLVFLRADGQLAIVDWKASDSRATDHARQLLVYGLAALRSGMWPRAMSGGIQLYEVNLLTNRIRQHSMTANRVDEAEDFVYRSLVEMNTLVPESSYEKLDLNDFDVADKPTTCQYCSVGPLCVRLFEEAGRPAEASAIQGRLW